MYSEIAFSSWATPDQLSRLIRLLVISPNHRSTRFSHDECFLSSEIPGIRHMSFPENTTGNSRLSPSGIIACNVTMSASASVQAPPSFHRHRRDSPAMTGGWIVQKSIETVSFSSLWQLTYFLTCSCRSCSEYASGFGSSPKCRSNRASSSASIFVRQADRSLSSKSFVRVIMDPSAQSASPARRSASGRASCGSSWRRT